MDNVFYVFDVHLPPLQCWLAKFIACNDTNWIYLHISINDMHRSVLFVFCSILFPALLQVPVVLVHPQEVKKAGTFMKEQLVVKLQSQEQI